MQPLFTGPAPAIATLFDETGQRIDSDAMRAYINWLITGNVSAIVACGTTGESPTVTHDENIEVVRIAVETANGRVPVIAGTGSNSTAEAVALTQRAKDVGADAALAVCPYYNCPSQRGLKAHFRAMAEVMPIIIYNIPKRTGISIDPESIYELWNDDGCSIIGVKDATNSSDWTRRVVGLTEGQLPIYSGDDGRNYEIVCLGGVGSISVVANVAPRMAFNAHCAAMAKQGDALEKQLALQPLIDALFSDSNPIPLKAALAMMGMGSPAMRLPLVPLEEAAEAHLRQVLTDFGILSEEAPTRAVG